MEDQRKRAKQLPPSPRPVNIRKVVELAFQRIQSQDWDEVEKLFTDLHFLETKNEGGKIFELIKEFSLAIENVPGVRPKHKILLLLQEALRRDVHFIFRHSKDYPQALFQCLWNSCWWYDCPQAINYYEEKEGPWSEEGIKLYQLLEQWRIQKEIEIPGFLWLQSLRPPRLKLGTAQVAILYGYEERNHENGILSIAISDDNSLIVAGSMDNTTRVWDFQSGNELHVLKGHELPVTSVAISSDNRKIVSGSYDNTIKIWDTDSGIELRTLKKHGEGTNRVVISKDSKWIASSSGDETIRVWDIESGTELKILKGHTGSVESLAISGDGRLIISGSSDRTIRIWDAEAGTQLDVLKGHNEPISKIAINKDGQWLVSYSYDNTMKIWYLNKEVRTLKGNYNGIAINSNSQQIMSSSLDKIIFWDIHTGKELRILKIYEEHIQCASMSNDNRWVICGCYDNKVRIMDMSKNEKNNLLKTPDGDITVIKFSSDGRHIVSSHVGQTKGIWEMASGEMLGSVLTSEIDSFHLVDYPRIINRLNAKSIVQSRIEVLFEFQNGYAFFPEKISQFKWADERQKTWVGGINNYLCIIRIEGDVN